jgi:hypothetical protein
MDCNPIENHTILTLRNKVLDKYELTLTCDNEQDHTDQQSTQDLVSHDIGAFLFNTPYQSQTSS